jgi:hypothetical protein
MNLLQRQARSTPPLPVWSRPVSTAARTVIFMRVTSVRLQRWSHDVGSQSLFRNGRPIG